MLEWLHDTVPYALLVVELALLTLGLLDLYVRMKEKATDRSDA